MLLAKSMIAQWAGAVSQLFEHFQENI